jgi:diguanylate cyclase (GGDEF)-like protein
MINIESFPYVELNIFAMVILFLVFISMNYCTKKYTFEQKLFLGLILSNALILVFDTVFWVINGRSGLFLRELNFLANSVYYILNPVPCVLWSMYAYFQVYRDEKRTKRLIKYLIIPALINVVFVILNYFGDFAFYVDKSNYYHRGNIFWIMTIVSSFYLLATFAFIIMKRNKIEKNYFIPIFVLAVPTLIADILQAVIAGLSIAWISMAISILIVFINIQINLLYTDFLTGLCNRRQLDFYLRAQIENNSNGKKLIAGIMIDIDHFKEINDTFGHAAGDHALTNAAKILVKSFRKKDLIARYGGDEFVIVFEVEERVDLIKAVNRIKQNVNQFNFLGNSPYHICFSIGYDIFDRKYTTQQFIQLIDSLMYQDKKNKKNQNGSSKELCDECAL